MADQFHSLGASLKQLSDKRRSDLISQLAQDFRRLRTFENERDWIAAVLDAATPFCFRAVFFSVLAGKLEWKAARNVELAPGHKVPLKDASAFAEAAQSIEITIALKTPGELSKPLAQALGEEPGEKIALIPIAANGRTMAILYAEEADTAGLELVAAMAGSALDVHQLKNKSTASGLLQIAPASQDGEDEEIHLRAQRYARLKISEIRLYESENVQTGRLAKNLYQTLQTRIDEARESYRNQFAACRLDNASSTMVDYLDREIVRSLANGDRDLLGPGYPGPLA